MAASSASASPWPQKSSSPLPAQMLGKVQGRSWADLVDEEEAAEAAAAAAEAPNSPRDASRCASPCPSGTSC